MRLEGTLAVVGAVLFPGIAEAGCARFEASTMLVPSETPAAWRLDYPPAGATSEAPWLAVDFGGDPEGYMAAVLGTARDDFRRDGDRLVGSGSEPWWISEWLDYGTSGREPRMGLTKERSPRRGDLAPDSPPGYQVWAVGFYNAPGASVLGQAFADPCDPSLLGGVLFPEGTASIKFLFTDADPAVVTYLTDAPVYSALIDPPLGPNEEPNVAERVPGEVRLLQVDISVKDDRASSTGWVFGTFAWVGPPRGDELFDNLVPVSLQWGNDPARVRGPLEESWVNPVLAGIMYGWRDRPFLGFGGRANGPADNLISSCLSCHAAARAPRSPALGVVSRTFRMSDAGDPMRVAGHLATWFTNLPAGMLFSPGEPGVALDYSLQLEAAVDRMCDACVEGDLSGTTPAVCRSARLRIEVSCAEATEAPVLVDDPLARLRTIPFDPPPRQ